MMSTACESKPA